MKAGANRKSCVRERERGREDTRLELVGLLINGGKENGQCKVGEKSTVAA